MHLGYTDCKKINYDLIKRTWWFLLCILKSVLCCGGGLIEVEQILILFSDLLYLQNIKYCIFIIYMAKSFYGIFK